MIPNPVFCFNFFFFNYFWFRINTFIYRIFYNTYYKWFKINYFWLYSYKKTKFIFVYIIKNIFNQIFNLFNWNFILKMELLIYQLYPLFTEIFIFTNICILLLYASINSSNSKLGFPLLSKNTFFLSLQIAVFGLLLLIFQNPIFLSNWYNFFISDSVTNFLKILILSFFIIWLITAKEFHTFENILKFEYWILALLALLASFFVLQSYDLLSIYLSIELQSLIFYILASFKRNSEFSTEAGIKYFILGAFSSALLLFGSSTLYNLTGLTNINDFSKFFNNDLLENCYFINEVVVSLIILLISFLFKLSAAPFHMWTPDVYEGSPTTSTMFFSVIPKLSILIVIIRLTFLSFYSLQNYIYYLFLISILFSSIIGTFSAFYQKKWKRFITFSSISHISFFLLNLILGDSTSLSILIFYSITYFFMLSAFFIFFINLKFLKFPTILSSRYLDSIKSLSYLNPLLAASFTLIIFSIAGIPPLIGFFSKFFVFFSAIKQKIFSISFLVLLMNCVSCFYYLRLIKLIYFESKPILLPILLPYNKVGAFSLGVILLILVFSFFELEFIFNLSNLVIFSIFH